MKKISQGKYELFTTKADAIHKFMQMQDICREELSGEMSIAFYCTKKGRIFISNPPTRHVENYSSTNLYGQVIEQEGKVFVTYYTAFSQANRVIKMIFFALYSLMAILSVVAAILGDVSIYQLPIMILLFAFFGIKLFSTAKEKQNSPMDSHILIKELENRVEAVNLWDQ